MESQQFKLNQRVDNNLAVWEEFKEITAKYNCLTLGEGSPATNPPEFAINDLTDAVREGHNQYTRSFGNPLLVNKIAEIYGPKVGRKVDPLTEVTVGIGAYYVIFDLMMALIKPEEKDEVVVFEPSYPCYYDHIQYAGGIVKPALLDFVDGEWKFNPESFRKALSERTKVFILNNAQNPTGKIFTKEEMEQISKILEEFPQVVVMSDDVYEFLTFDHKEFVCYASLGNNFDRTVTIFSGGKLFNATGWKVGWGIGPAHIMKHCGLLTYASLYCVNTPIQVGMSKSLDKITKPDYKDGLSYIDFTRKEFEDVRNLIFKELQTLDIPIVPLKCESGYFLMADISKCKDMIPSKYLDSHEFEELKEGDKPVTKNRYVMEDGRVPLDLAFCRWIAVERGVIMMPCSLFYHKTSPYRNDHFVRIAICKGMDHSAKAMERLKAKKE